MARLHSPDAGALGWIPAWGAKSYLPQLRARMPRHTENPMCGSEEAVQPNQYILKKKKKKQNGKNSSQNPPRQKVLESMNFKRLSHWAPAEAWCPQNGFSDRVTYACKHFTPEERVLCFHKILKGTCGH